jgi:hypothetical protein
MRRGSVIVVPNIHANSKTGQAVLADRQKPDQMTVAERGTKSRQKNCCAIAILRPENRWLACYIAIKEIAEGGNISATSRVALAPIPAVRESLGSYANS